MRKLDPLGYYTLLQVEADAPPSSIKAAFRRLAMELHPDRNNSSVATARFQQINTAYRVLKDPRRRALYDAQTAMDPPLASRSEPAELKPISCSICGVTSEPLRYRAFWVVRSFHPKIDRNLTPRIYCARCAEKESYAATAETCLVGWFAFPLGPVYTIRAFFSNMFGGVTPPLANSQLLARQAAYFRIVGQHVLASDIAREGLLFAKRIPMSDKKRDFMIGHLQQFIVEVKAPKYTNAWPVLSRAFFAHLGVLGLVVGLFLARCSSKR